MSIRLLEDGRELASFTSDEVTRVEIMFDHGKQVYVLEGDTWHVLDVEESP